jgi:carbonic anhydrase
MSSQRFATAINCMDGRVQVPIMEYLKTKYGVDYVDMITEAGPVYPLSRGEMKNIIDSIRKRVEISVHKHHSQLIAIVAHADCAGNPVDKETQIRQLLAAVKKVAAWNFRAQVIGLWVDQRWKVNEVG